MAEAREQSKGDVVTFKKSTERIKPVLKARVLRPQNAREATKALAEDPFYENYDRYNLVYPPFALLTLATLLEYCTELRPSIDAMQVNIEKLGWKIIPRVGVESEEGISIEVKREMYVLRNFFMNAVLDEDVGTLEELRARSRVDLETTGNGYMEIIPNVNDSSHPEGLEHLPSWTMRIRKQDDEFTDYEVPRAVQDENGKWSIKMFPMRKRFRRYAQIRESGSEIVWFKEWGDPRPISSTTGEVITGEIDTSDLAHEVIHLKLYCPRSPYGLPRTIGHLFAVYGNRGAEEINYMTLDNNQIPALVLMATNVALTDGSLERIQEFIEERVQGNKNYATILLVEGEPISEDAMRDPGSMKLEIKPLTEYQHDDAMFMKYMQFNNDTIRRAFRLPPIFVGRSEEYNRATADASRKLGEEQIFGPERKSIDEIFNHTITMRLGIANVVFKSNTPDITDNYELTQLLATAERSGGLTPRISRAVVEDVTGKEYPEFPEEVEPDHPFSMTMLDREYSLQAQVGIVPGDDKVHGNDKKEDTEKMKLLAMRMLLLDMDKQFLQSDEREVLNRIVEDLHT